MDKEKIKEKLKKKNEIYVVTIQLLTKKYVQSIRIEKNKVQYNYYEVQDNDLIEIKDANILKNLIDKYELKPNPIVYIEDKDLKDKFEIKYKIQKKDSKEQKNSYLNSWVEEFVSNKLTNCRVFRKVFGKNFAKRNIEGIEVYIKEKIDENCSGLCDLNGKIEIYLKIEDNEYYSISSLLENEHILSVILHEGIHDVLRDGNGLTGIIMQINSHHLIKKNSYSELGRAFNEGLTEWVVEKSGLGGYVGFEYQIFLRMVKLIELKLGEKRVMSLLKDNPLQIIDMLKLRHIQKILKMSKYDVIDLLSKTDSIYNLFLQKDELSSKIKAIEEYENIENIKDEEKIKEINKKYIDAKIDVNSLENEDYKDFLEERNLEHSDETLKKYYKELIYRKNRTIKQLQTSCDSIIFEVYFEKEIKKVLKREQISKEEMIKFSKIYSLINLNMGEDDTSIDFAKKYQELKAKYILSVNEQMKQKYENGNLKLSEFAELLEWGEINFNIKLSIMHSDFVDAIIKNFANTISPQYSEDIQRITRFLYDKNNINELDGYLLKVIRRDKWRKIRIIL